MLALHELIRRKEQASKMLALHELIRRKEQASKMLALHELIPNLLPITHYQLPLLLEKFICKTLILSLALGILT